MDVVLLKSTNEDAYSNEADPYINLLKSREIPVELIETMSFSICGCLFERLCKWRLSYSCIVFCSQRAVFSYASTNLIGLPEDLCFTVGPATSSAASKLGFTTRGSHTGNAKNLAKFILDNYAKEVSEKPILLLTGARHSPVLPNRLREAGVLVEEVVLYCSAPNPNFETQLFSMLKKRENRSQYLVFFSPSGVEMAWPTLSKFISQSNYTIRLIAIGPTTGEKVEALHLPLAATCQSPTPESLFECLLQVIPRHAPLLPHRTVEG